MLIISVPGGDLTEFTSETVRVADWVRDQLASESCAEFRIALAELNAALRPGATENQELGFDAVSPAALVRHLQYHVEAQTRKSAIEGQTRTTDGEDRTRRRSYKDLADRIEEFMTIVNHNLSPERQLIVSINSERVRDYCTFHTFSRGTAQEFFYAILCLYSHDLADQGAFEEPHFKKLLPRSEAGFVKLTREWLRARYDELKIDPKSQRMARSPDSGPSVRVNFRYTKERQEELARYVKRFQTEEQDHHAHFICYRPRLSDPKELMKTFLVISPPWRDGLMTTNENFNFSSFYLPPRSVGQGDMRLATGRAIPLKDGLFLIGGSRLASRTDLPFHGLEAVVLPWHSIERYMNLLPGLCLTSNFGGTPMVTRMALRATPLHRSDMTQLGSVKLSNLAYDLETDLKRERETIQDVKGFAERNRWETPGTLDANAMADKIREMTNNNPSHRAIDVPFESMQQGANPNLTSAHMEHMLERHFGSNQHPVFQDPTARPFDFWYSVRFGVIR